MSAKVAPIPAGACLLRKTRLYRLDESRRVCAFGPEMAVCFMVDMMD